MWQLGLGLVFLACAACTAPRTQLVYRRWRARLFCLCCAAALFLIGAFAGGLVGEGAARTLAYVVGALLGFGALIEALKKNPLHPGR